MIQAIALVADVLTIVMCSVLGCLLWRYGSIALEIIRAWPDIKQCAVRIAALPTKFTASMEVAINERQGRTESNRG
ncbi:MAG: hypothetical protein AAF184_09770 [Pseudomonadota bacterium]